MFRFPSFVLVVAYSLAAPAFSQDLAVSVIEATTETTTTVVTETCVKDEAGNLIGEPSRIAGDPSEPETSVEKLVSISTLAPIVTVEAEAKDWTPVEVVLANEQGLDNRRLYRLIGKGKVKVTVETRGPDVENWDRKTLIVDVTPPAPPSVVADNLRVMITYETSSVPRYVANIIGSPIIRNYLREKCAKGGDGAPQFRFIDRDTHFPTCENGFWCKSLERVREKGPQIIIKNDLTSFEGDLPGTVNEVLDLLKRYGG